MSIDGKTNGEFLDGRLKRLEACARCSPGFHQGDQNFAEGYERLSLSVIEIMDYQSLDALFGPNDVISS